MCVCIVCVSVCVCVCVCVLYGVGGGNWTEGRQSAGERRGSELMLPGELMVDGLCCQGPDFRSLRSQVWST